MFLMHILVCSVDLPDIFPELLSCHFNSHCTSLQCCLNLDLKVAQLSSKAWFELDPCDYTVSIGLDSWYFNASLFSYQWGKLEEFSIGQAIDVK